MYLIGSFIDMMGASASRIIAEALEDESCKAWPTWSIPGAIHVQALASTFDANLKLLRRHGVLNALDLQSHLSLAAHRLPFEASGSRLFGEGLAELLGLEEDMATKKHTMQLSQAMIRQFSSKGGARPK